MSCGMEHNQAVCPKCGSKMKRVEVRAIASAMSGGYNYDSTDNKLEQNLRWFLTSTLNQNKEMLYQLHGVKDTVEEWYKDKNHYEGKRESKDVILSIIVNKIIEEILRHLQCYYVNSIIKKIGIETQFKNGI